MAIAMRPFFDNSGQNAIGQEFVQQSEALGSRDDWNPLRIMRRLGLLPDKIHIHASRTQSALGVWKNACRTGSKYHWAVVYEENGNNVLRANTAFKLREDAEEAKKEAIKDLGLDKKVRVVHFLYV